MSSVENASCSQSNCKSLVHLFETIQRKISPEEVTLFLLLSLGWIVKLTVDNGMIGSISNVTSVCAASICQFAK